MIESRKKEISENCFSNSSSFAHHANHSIGGVRSIFDLRSRLKLFFRFVLVLKFPPKTFSIHFCKSYRWMVCATIWVSDYFIIKRSGFTKVNALICVQVLEQVVTHNFHSRISSIKTTYVNTKQCGKWNLIRSQNWNEKLWFQSLRIKTNWLCDLKAFG